MGRGKLSMELIIKEKSRMLTYQKRKKGLLKKAKELSILCDIKTCVIVFGPKSGESQNPTTELVTFPQDRNEVTSVINKFMGKPLPSSSDVSCRKNSNNLSDFFAARKKKVDDEISKQRKENLEAKFPSWDDSMNGFSMEQLRVVEEKIRSKLEAAKRVIGKSKSFSMENYWNTQPAGSSTQLFNHSIESTTQIPKVNNFLQFDQGYNNNYQMYQMQQGNNNQHLPAYNNYYPLNNNHAMQMFLYPGSANYVPIINNNEMQSTQSQSHDFYGGDHRQWMDRVSSSMQIPQCKFPTAGCYNDATLENVVYNQFPMSYSGVPNMQPQQQLMPNIVDNGYSSLLTQPEFHEYFNDTMPKS